MEYVREMGDRLTRSETIEQVRASVDQESEHLAALLNDVAPLRAALASLVPEARAWRFRFGTSDSHLWISVSPDSHVLPAPPANHIMMAASPIQFWIHGNISETAARDIFNGCARVNDLLGEKHRKVAGDRSSPIKGIAAAREGDWLVIQVGQAAIEVVRPASSPAENQYAKTVSGVSTREIVVPASFSLRATPDKVTTRVNLRVPDRMRRPSD